MLLRTLARVQGLRLLQWLELQLVTMALPLQLVLERGGPRRR